MKTARRPTLALLAALSLAAAVLVGSAHSGPAPPPPTAAVESRIAALRVALAKMPQENPAAKRAIGYGSRYLEAASAAMSGGQGFVADRLAVVAECLTRIAGRESGAEEMAPRPGRPGGGPLPHAPPRPPAPPAVGESLDRLYFRIRQADFFADELHDERASELALWARDYYREAIRAHDSGDWRVADGQARSAADLVAALEHLAQARSGRKAPPAPPAPPPGKPRKKKLP